MNIPLLECHMRMLLDCPDADRHAAFDAILRYCINGEPPKTMAERFGVGLVIGMMENLYSKAERGRVGGLKSGEARRKKKELADKANEANEANEARTKQIEHNELINEGMNERMNEGRERTAPPSALSLSRSFVISDAHPRLTADEVWDYVCGSSAWRDGQKPIREIVDEFVTFMDHGADAASGRWRGITERSHGRELDGGEWTGDFRAFLNQHEKNKKNYFCGARAASEGVSNIPDGVRSDGSFAEVVARLV